MIVRSDSRPQHNFAVVVDDALMEVTHVIRGEDHISNTPRQILLYQALGFTPPEFAHLSLVLGPDHTPLSKRHGATSVAEFRARGYLLEALVNYLALIGWSPRTEGGSGENDAELLPVDEMARRFAIEDVGHSAGVFDIEKLAWMNRHYMKAAAPAPRRRVAALLHGPRIHQPAQRRGDGVRLAHPADGGRLRRPAGRFPTASGSLRLRSAAALATREVGEVIETAGARDVVLALADELRNSVGSIARLRAAATRVKQRTGQKGRALFHPIRVALTGRQAAPSSIWRCRRSIRARSCHARRASP